MGINSKKTTGEVRPVLAAIPSDWVFSIYHRLEQKVIHKIFYQTFY